MSSSRVPIAADVVIIGGGFAGVASAWALARRGITDVVLLEREAALGQHTSGRGAGLGRQLADDDPTTALTVRGAALLRSELADAWTETGGVLGFDDEDEADRFAARAARFGVAAERVAGADLARRWRGFADARVRVAAALYVPSDGVIDVVRLLARMEAAIGARAFPDAEVIGLDAGRAAGEPHVVRTARGAVSARVVVEATGAWAGQLLGALPPTIVKRHVFVLDARPGADAGAAAASPWLWQTGARQIYMRDHADGTLTSPCDATTAAAGDYAVEPDAEVALRARLAEVSPALANAPVVRQWACGRTFTGDRQMRLERDAERPWLVWAIGLGGHGATASPAVGETVAAAVADALA